jgi:hypothetical protein
MSEPRMDFADWVGQPVMLNGQDVGLLDEVNDFGIVIRAVYPIWWRTPESLEGDGLEGEIYYRETHVERVVSLFRPWHTISDIRVMESDEREAHGF